MELESYKKVECLARTMKHVKVSSKIYAIQSFFRKVSNLYIKQRIISMIIP